MAEDYGKWLEGLKAKINICDVVGSYVNLQQKGSRKWACCPFHHEKTPSFCLNEGSGLYYCFGCHKGGDSINFVMEIEHTDFNGAIKILADKYGIKVPEFSGNGNFAKSKAEFDRLYEMMKETANYFHGNLVGESGEQAREYLRNRGITSGTATTFGLGLSLGYNQLISFLASKGYTLQEMEKAGLVDTKNDKYYDSMAGRLIVPIINNLKQVIAFGGRVIEKDKMPKYKNTKETVLFNKSRELFGQHTIKKLKLEEAVSDIIMVEGYMDVISLYQAGIKNAMASMGTALTSEQAKLLKRYCNKVYICYDGDSAGQNATIRGLDILYHENLDVKVMSLTDNLDPDEYVRKYSKDGFLQLMMSAQPLFEFKIFKAASGHDLNTADGRGKFAVEAVALLKSLANPVEVDAYMPLVERLSGIGKSVLYKQFNQTVATVSSAPRVQNTQKLSNSGFDKAVRYILYVLYGGVENMELEEDLTQYIIDDNQLELYETIRMSGRKQLSLNDLTAMEEKNPEVRAILEEGSKVSDENAKHMFGDCISLIKTKSTGARIAAIAKAIDSETDEEVKILLTAQLAGLNKKK